MPILAATLPSPPLASPVPTNTYIFLPHIPNKPLTNLDPHGIFSPSPPTPGRIGGSTHVHIHHRAAARALPVQCIHTPTPAAARAIPIQCIDTAPRARSAPSPDRCSHRPLLTAPAPSTRLRLRARQPLLPFHEHLPGCRRCRPHERPLHRPGRKLVLPTQRPRHAQGDRRHGRNPRPHRLRHGAHQGHDQSMASHGRLIQPHRGPPHPRRRPPRNPPPLPHLPRSSGGGGSRLCENRRGCVRLSSHPSPLLPRPGGGGGRASIKEQGRRGSVSPCIHHHTRVRPLLSESCSYS